MQFITPDRRVSKVIVSPGSGRMVEVKEMLFLVFLKQKELKNVLKRLAML